MVSYSETYDEDASLNNQGQDSQVVVPVGFTTPCPFPSFPPNLAFNKLPPSPRLSAKDKDMQAKVKCAPALPDMSDDCTSSSSSFRPFPYFKILPRFTTLSGTTVEAMPPMMRMRMSHLDKNNGSASSTAMMEILSSDDEEEESTLEEDATSSLTESTSLASSSFDTEDESLATLSSMETTRQERLDAIMRTNKVSPHKKTMHLKHPMPQRPGAVLQQQPRRHSLSAIAA